jgi:hypothetical protein
LQALIGALALIRLATLARFDSEFAVVADGDCDLLHDFPNEKSRLRGGLLTVYKDARSPKECRSAGKPGQVPEILQKIKILVAQKQRCSVVFLPKLKYY